MPRIAPHPIFLGVKWKAVVQRLTVARQEAVAVPDWRRTLMSRRSRRDGRQQRQDDSNRQKHETRHGPTIDRRLSGGDSNLSAQSSAAASVIAVRRRRPKFSTRAGIVIVMWAASIVTAAGAHTVDVWRYLVPAVPMVCIMMSLFAVELAETIAGLRRA